MKIENLKEDQIVYEVGRQKMGNTTISTVVVWEVRIVSVDLERRIVKARWNSNPTREYREMTWRKWRAVKPMLVLSGFGCRLATREEIEATKKAEAAK